MHRVFDYVFFPNSPAVDAYFALKHIHLAFCMTEFCEFFGARLFWLEEEPEDDDDMKHSPGVLKILPQLNHLELAFPSPATEAAIDFNYVSQPWKCQLLIVDTILTFAFPYIKHIPEVELCGAIKNTTKGKWTRILREDKGGIPHQEQIEMEIKRLEDTVRNRFWSDE